MLNNNTLLWYNKLIMILNKIRNTIYKQGLISQDEHIVIGLSGGPDSVCLFHALCMLKSEFNLHLYAVHLNHLFRPGDAEKDQKYVEDLCETYRVQEKSFVVDVSRYAKDQNLSSEEAGRKIRYRCFYEEAEKIREIENNYDLPIKIAVAQNLNDQAETLLMRIIRGTGVDGLAGIEYKRAGEKNTVIIRPLLDVDRQDIEAYCKEEGLEPRIDQTNSLPIYTRNKIRLGLIPYIKENYNENIVKALNRLSKIAKFDKDYIAGVVEKTLDTHAKVKLNSKRGDIATIPLKVMQELHPAIRHRTIMILFGKIGLSQDITSTHLTSADYVIEEGRTSSKVDFPGEYRLQISYGVVEMLKKEREESNSFFYFLDVYQGETSLYIREADCRINAKTVMKPKNDFHESVMTYVKALFGSNWRSNCTVALNYDEILKSGLPLVVRTRMQGDWIVPQGMAGKKKIQNFFVDSKISKDERDSVPLLCLGTEAIWVLGKRISENYKIKDDTENILILEYSKEI